SSSCVSPFEGYGIDIDLPKPDFTLEPLLEFDWENIDDDQTHRESRSNYQPVLTETGNMKRYNAVMDTAFCIGVKSNTKKINGRLPNAVYEDKIQEAENDYRQLITPLEKQLADSKQQFQQQMGQLKLQMDKLAEQFRVHVGAIEKEIKKIQRQHRLKVKKIKQDGRKHRPD
ncbi:unnamed protein product, partial [Didymodactylos carnosus]